MRMLHLWLLAVEAHAALGPIAERDGLVSSGDVQLSIIQPFEPWPGFFRGKDGQEARSFQRRSPDSVYFCEVARPSPQDAGWLLDQAVCNLQSRFRAGFIVNCVSAVDDAYTFNDLTGRCRNDDMCMEFHGHNARGRAAWDVMCVARATVREWFVDSIRAEHSLACSPFYVNSVESHRSVNMSLQTNVLDSHRQNRIAPANVYYLLDGKTKIGVERAFDSVVGSGVITVPPGSKVQACVQAIMTQTLWATVGLTSLDIVPSES